MSLLPRELLVACFTNKLNGHISKEKEHIFYSFEINGQVVAATHISPPSKYRDFGDDILSKIASGMGTTRGRLDKSSRCDPTATREILDGWRSQLGD